MSRFDDMTYENIKNNMLEDVKEDFGVDADEGSLIDIAVSKFALRLEDAYKDLANVDDNLLIDTMDREHLIESGSEVGLTIDEGDYAQLSGYVNVKVDVGTEFSAADYDYNFTAVEYVGEAEIDKKTYYKYVFEADDLGSEPNGFTGDIEPIDAIDGFEVGKITSLITAGKDEEDTEAYRARRLEYFFDRAASGNRAYYKKEVSEFDGVETCKIKRKEKNDDYIYIYVLADGYALPTDDLIESLQEYIDPSSEGQGMGMAPIGHKVKIMKPGSESIAVTACLEFEQGQDYDTLKTSIEDAVIAYLQELRKQWDSVENVIVRVSGIERKLLEVKGIVDVSSITINLSASNLKLDEYTVPVFGSFTYKKV